MKKLLIAVIIIILLAVVLIYSRSSEMPPSETATHQPADTTESIAKDLNSFEVGSTEADFNAVNADLNRL